jgi:hypothetical protein
MFCAGCCFGLGPVVCVWVFGSLYAYGSLSGYGYVRMERGVPWIELFERETNGRHVMTMYDGARREMLSVRRRPRAIIRKAAGPRSRVRRLCKRVETDMLWRETAA